MNKSEFLLREKHGRGWFALERISPQTVLLLLSAFILLVAAFGGSSRPDPVQIVPLRTLAALFLIPAVGLMDRKSWSQAPALLGLAGAFVLWMAVQLMPLPPSIWHGLPDRAIIAQVDRLVGLDDNWRPLSLAPMRGTAALVSLVVPAAALLLALACRFTSKLILHAILAIGLINAMLGLIQVGTGPESPLYFYLYVARRSAAGLFANENHSTVFSVVVLLIIARLAAESHLANRGDLFGTKVAYPAAFVFILLTVLVSGSRAGLAALFVALGAAAVMASKLAIALPRQRRRAQGNTRLWRGSAGLSMLFLALAMVLIGVFFLQERTPALQEILDKSSFDDLRWRIFPILQEMVARHWLLGTGFGSFDMLYQTYEPTELVMVAYVNHAHNDWMQLVIEGGLPASLLLVALLAWIASSILKLRCDARPQRSSIALVFWCAVMIVIGAASIVDYPLRTPIFQVVGVWLLACLERDAKNRDADP